MRKSELLDWVVDKIWGKHPSIYTRETAYIIAEIRKQYGHEMPTNRMLDAFCEHDLGGLHGGGEI